MIRFSKKVEYALMTMLYMSKKKHANLITARELSQRFNIPTEILGKVLQSLARNGLITSMQGTRGGYLLQQSLNDINIINVIEAVDGPIHLVNCMTPGKSRECERIKLCGIQEPLRMIQSKLNILFSSISLQDLQNHHQSLRELSNHSGGISIKQNNEVS